MNERKRLRRGETEIRIIPLTKRDFLNVDSEDRNLFFMAAQTLNELAMLRAITLQALENDRGHRVVQETSLAMAFMSGRFLAAKVVEGWVKLFEKQKNAKRFEALWSQLPAGDGNEQMREDVEAARAELTEYFAQEDALLRRVRNKLAFHLDATPISEAFDLIEDDFSLSDFHTGVRGTTFYGGADSLIAVAASALAGDNDPTRGMHLIVEDSSRLSEALGTVIDGYLVSFVLAHLGVERLHVPPTTVRYLPDGVRCRLGFYFDTHRIRAAAKRGR